MTTTQQSRVQGIIRFTPMMVHPTRTLIALVATHIKAAELASDHYNICRCEVNL
jgi:hypothetical protein